MKKFMLVLPLFLIFLAVISGCSLKSAGPEAKKKELLLLLPDNKSELSQYRINTFEQYARQFEEKNYNVIIRIEKIPAREYSSVITERIKKQEPVDLIFNSYDPVLAKEGVFADLLSFYKTERISTDDLYRALVDMVTMNGKMLGVPMSPQPLAVFYNKEWFNKASLSDPAGDWTWEQYFEISAKLQMANMAEGKQLFGSAIPVDPPFFETLARSSGHSIMSDDGSKFVGYLDSEPVSKAIAMMLQNINSSRVTKPTNSSMNSTYLELTSGNIGMSVGQFGVYSLLASQPQSAGKIGVVQLPRLENGVRANAVYFEMLSIASASKNQPLAWQFIKEVVLNKDSPFQEDWSRRELLTSKAAIQKTGQQLDPVMGLFLGELEYAVQPALYKSPELAAISIDAIAARLVTSSTPAEVRVVLEEVARTIEGQLKSTK